MTPSYRKLNRNKLNNRKHHIISSEESLKDIIPIEWSVSVLTGAKQISISSYSLSTFPQSLLTSTSSALSSSPGNLIHRKSL